MILDVFMWCGLGWFIAVSVLVLIQTDRFLRLLHREFPATWRELGEPGGFFWWPRGCSYWKGFWSRDRIVRRQFFRRPQWAALDPRLHALWKSSLLLYCTGVIGWAFGMIGLLTPR